MEQQSATGLTPEYVNDVSPMRRGRPTKPNSGPSLPPVASSSNLRSEWQVPENEEEQYLPSSSPAIAGFGDSFAPPVTIHHPVGAEPEQPASEPAQSKTAAATLALFEELSTPGSSLKSPPTLASLAAARSQNQAPLGQSNENSTSNPKAPSRTSFGPVRRITPTKPLGPRPQTGPKTGVVPMQGRSTNSISLSVPTAVPQRSSSAMPAPERLSEEPEQLGPPAESTITMSKPQLVSRGSQTSPSLLSQWKKRDGEALMQRSGQLRISQQQAGDEDGSAVQEKFPSLDDWEDARISFTSANAASSGSDTMEGNLPLTQTALHRGDATYDLLGDIDDSTNGIPDQQEAPADPSSTQSCTKEPQSESTTLSASSTAPVAASSQHVASPLPSPNLIADATIQSTSANSSLSKEKYKPVKRDSPLVQRQLSSMSNSSSVSSSLLVAAANTTSEEDEGPESASGLRYGQNGRGTPKAQSKIEPENNSRRISGNFDIGPALSSIERFAPRPGSVSGPGSGAPPIVAPKPERAALRSLVSRYETMSGAPPTMMSSSAPSLSSSTPAENVATPSESTRANISDKPKTEKPIKPPKSSTLAASKSTQPFESRFPALNGAGASASVPGLAPKKQPFKPSRESSSNSISSLATASPGEVKARPKSMLYPTPPRSTMIGSSAGESQSHPTPLKGMAKEEEPEEGYRSVASLRDRWQQGIASQK